MSLADELAEKHCDTNHSERAASMDICTHCQFVAAINEAILLTKNEWIERCAQECDDQAELIRQANTRGTRIGQPAQFAVDAIRQIAARIRALKEQP